MPSYFLDTSALGKHYHPEIGTAKVEHLLQEPGARHFVSRLTAVEILSVFAGKVRTGVIAAADFQLLRRRFLTEASRRQFSVVRMTGYHFQEAQRLITKHGPTQGLRTLDALQLSVAFDLRNRGLLDGLVCADQRFIALALTEGFAVIDPEQP
jgi:hypothetical protein